jgi:hypothetical protein
VLFSEPLPPLLLYEILLLKRFDSCACILRAIFLFLCDRLRLCFRLWLDSSFSLKSCLGCFLSMSQQIDVVDSHKKDCHICDKLEESIQIFRIPKKMLFGVLCSAFGGGCNLRNLFSCDLSKSNSVQTIFGNFESFLCFCLCKCVAKIEQSLMVSCQSWTKYIITHYFTQEDCFKYA